jgi:hypothetical protein
LSRISQKSPNRLKPARPLLVNAFASRLASTATTRSRPPSIEPACTTAPRPASTALAPEHPARLHHRLPCSSSLSHPAPPQLSLPSRHSPPQQRLPPCPARQSSLLSAQQATAPLSHAPATAQYRALPASYHRRAALPYPPLSDYYPSSRRPRLTVGHRLIRLQRIHNF